MLPLISPYHHPHVQLPLFSKAGNRFFWFLSAQVWLHRFHYRSQDNLSHAWLGYIRVVGMSGIFSGKKEKALETEDGISNISLPKHRSQCKQMTEQLAKISHTPLPLTAPQLPQCDGCFDRLETNTFPTPSKRLL